MRRGTDVASAWATLAAAGLAIAGAVIVREHPVGGHTLVFSGMGVFAVSARLPPENREPLRSVRPRPWLPPLAILLFVLATLAKAFSFHDAIVVWSWLAGVVVTIVGGFVSVVAETHGFRLSRAFPPLVVAIVSAAVSLVRLEDFPRAVHGDVGEVALAALEFDVSRDLFRPSYSWWSLPGLFLGIQRLGLAIDPGLLGARLPDAVVGVLATVFAYATVLEIGTRPTAFVTAVLAAGCASLINTWRSGMGFAPPVLLPLVSLWALLRAMRSDGHERAFFSVAGVAAGLSLQVYMPARILPFLLAAWIAHEMAFGSSESRRRAVRGFGWIVVAAVAVAGPLLWEYARDPSAMMPRAGRFLFSHGGFGHALHASGASSASELVWIHLLRSLGMFHFYESADGGSFLPNRGGFFEPLTAALFLLGVAASIVRPVQRHCAWPLLGCAISLMLVGGTVDAPSYSRAGPAAAMALLLVAIGCEAILDAVGRVVTRRRSVESGAPHPTAGRVIDAFAGTVACCGLLWGTWRYFVEYCGKEWPLSNSTAVARRITAEAAESSFTYLLARPGFDLRYGNIRFLARRHRGMDLEPGASPPGDLAPGVNLFIALPHRADELRALAGTLPPGRWEEHSKIGRPDELEILVLRIEVPATAGAS